MSKAMAEYQEKAKSLKAQMRKEGEAVFREMFKEFFEATPGVIAVRWTQYTPHFNDGEACVFGVREASFKFTPETRADLKGVESYSKDEEYLDHYSFDCPAALKELDKTLQSEEMADVLQVAFGDHAEIVATREEFTVEEYEHD